MFVLEEFNSIGNQFIAELRDITIQSDRLRFRKNLERIGEILAYEISKSFPYQEKEIQTPLAKTKIKTPSIDPVIFAVLRASIPFYQGFLNFFDRAESGFIGAFREEGSNEVVINLGYHASPNLEGKTVILADPMLATGKSFVRSIETILTHGTPEIIHIVAIIASPEGVKYIQENVKVPYKLWLGALDLSLNEKFYIVPGLGDAGDLAFGEKI
ncbi:MAG: uracil phosphoribosyltransferase [Algoriphagus sp.]|jgi:uracil phosphoribosyltransferase|uniref:uracil phosphoribosyltransferase n=1 Tax=Algoriphagus sp. TaxID=1872435 RepID=UPI0027277DE9|nr:uracil phosphoribosyltransferase [Algoriphagus sp.]MDO8968236.1 uracil phosphoribosyltransferase [Algoriphagus sp.]MDP2040944.1 uracil phosphoribosyltransferase [Algoriphagus sp.]MDP3200999.1 uracil phosphoribosyltransferase [Algoriphagus sp.]MDP3472935.1 uracil phosphoribosyltransferase [Algoriphagus sp.]